MIDAIDEAHADAFEAIAAARSLDELKAVEPELFGKRSKLGNLKSRLGTMEPDQRAAAGRALNEARDLVAAARDARRDELARAARRIQLEDERLDLTEAVSPERRGHLHLVTQARQRLEDVFVGMGYAVAEGPEVETDWYNFQALNMPPAHPARSMWDTLYVDLGSGDNILLRTHTSPVQIRLMQRQAPPIYAVMPGRVFRRDTPDASHLAVFHQIEGLVVDRHITLGDLAGTIEQFTTAYFGSNIKTRFRPSYFPFTEPSAEFDITDPSDKTGWLELGGCGMVHPNVLSAVDLDPEEWTGFAFGFGIDRLARTRHGLPDLRDVMSTDIRVLSQF